MVRKDTEQVEDDWGTHRLVWNGFNKLEGAAGAEWCVLREKVNPCGVNNGVWEKPFERISARWPLKGWHAGCVTAVLILIEKPQKRESFSDFN